jgi:hypothetical protein
MARFTSKLAKAIDALAQEGPRQGVDVADRDLGWPASLGHHLWSWRSVDEQHGKLEEKLGFRSKKVNA